MVVVNDRLRRIYRKSHLASVKLSSSNVPCRNNRGKEIPQSSGKASLHGFEPGSSLTQVEVLQLAAACSDPLSYPIVSKRMSSLIPYALARFGTRFLTGAENSQNSGNFSVCGKYFDGS
jgi:hypothetical protein